jgi:hypothetical protein
MGIMKTLEELSITTFYKMDKYSQLVIDLVEEVEDLFTYDSGEESFGALSYTVSNVLEIIDQNRHEDIEALTILSEILNSHITKLRNIEFKD